MQGTQYFPQNPNCRSSPPAVEERVRGVEAKNYGTQSHIPTIRSIQSTHFQVTAILEANRGQQHLCAEAGSSNTCTDSLVMALPSPSPLPCPPSTIFAASIRAGFKCFSDGKCSIFPSEDETVEGGDGIARDGQWGKNPDW